MNQEFLVKRILMSLLLAASLNFGTFQKDANAAVGLAFGPFGIGLDIIGGLSIAFSTPLVGVYGHELAHMKKDDPYYGSAVFGVALSSIWLAFGVIMLDDQGDFKFSALSESSAKKLQIPARSLAIYNSEVEELNTLAESIAQDLEGASDVKKAKAAWEAYSNYVSPETFTVAKLIANKVAALKK
jgi:hypothetical protein